MSDAQAGYTFADRPRTGVRARDVPDARLDGDNLLLAVPGGDLWWIPSADVVELRYVAVVDGVHLHLSAWPSPTGKRQVSVNFYIEGDRQQLELLMDRIDEINRRMRDIREPVPAEPVVEPYQSPPPEPIVGVGYAELDTDWLTFRPLRDTLALADGNLIQSDKAPEP